jgi:hypothetical protein
MSAKKLREQWGYEDNTPQCCNCVGYRRPHVVVEGGTAKRIEPPFCKKGQFTVKAGGCCDKWSSKKGERLK